MAMGPNEFARKASERKKKPQPHADAPKPFQGSIDTEVEKEERRRSLGGKAKK